MSNDSTILAKLLGLEDGAKAAVLRSRLQEQKEKFELSVPWEKIEALFIQRLMELLNTSVLDIWIEGLQKCRELSQFTDSGRFPPGELFEVSLWDHELVFKQKPALDIAIAKFPTRRIQFDVALSLKISAAVVTIGNAKIVSARWGDGKGVATLKYKDCQLLQNALVLVRLQNPQHLGDGRRLAVD